MPKATSPFLTSLSGTLKNSCTFRDNPQCDAITMQTRPVPTDHRTAKQAQVRDAYARLGYLWKTLSHLDKEPYLIMAEERNLTAWNTFLSYHLPIMRRAPILYCPFSEGSGVTTQNFALGGTQALIAGAAWAETNNFPALSFNGTTDYIKFNFPEGFPLSQPYTVYIRGSNLGPVNDFISIMTTFNQADDFNGMWLGFYDDYLELDHYTHGTELQFIYVGGLPPINTRTSMAVVVNRNSSKIYINGTQLTPDISGTTNPDPCDTLVFFGGYQGYPPTSGIGNILAILPSALSPGSIAALDAHYDRYLL